MKRSPLNLNNCKPSKTIKIYHSNNIPNECHHNIKSIQVLPTGEGKTKTNNMCQFEGRTQSQLRRLFYSWIGRPILVHIRLICQLADKISLKSNKWGEAFSPFLTFFPIPQKMFCKRPCLHFDVFFVLIPTVVLVFL